MEIRQDDDGRKGRFFVEDAGELLAQMTYLHHPGGILIIDHTEVDPRLKGQNTGYALVEAAVSFAREKGWKIKPLCPFALAVFRKKPHYADTWYQ